MKETIKSNEPLGIDLPVKGLPSMIADVYERLGVAFPKSLVPRQGEDRQPRTPFTRVERAMKYHEINLYRKLRRLPKMLRGWMEGYKPHGGAEYFRDLDSFDQQFQELKVEEIDLAEIGKMKAFYSHIVIERLRKLEKNKDKLPTFIVPAYAGSGYGVEQLARGLALEGNEVFILPAPEALLSETTEQFAAAVERSPIESEDVSYEPHTTYYQKAIERIQSQYGIPAGMIKVAGYSTGGAIVLELLCKKDFMAAEALILSPASSVKRGMTSFVMGTIKELTHAFPVNKLKHPLKSGIILGSNKIDQENSERRERISAVQLKKVRSKSKAYQKARVSEGGRIVVQAGALDEMTNAVKVLDEMRRNPQIVTVECPDMPHLGPLYEARSLVAALEQVETTKDLPASRKFIYQYGEMYPDR